MMQFDREVQINELLTAFLQTFKNIFAAKMSLIESICAKNNSLQSNPQYLLSRLSNKCFKFQWALDPQGIVITQQMVSSIQRFYLRIQEYLQFRLNTLLNLEDSAFNQQIDSFYKNLQKIILSIENNTFIAITLSSILVQVSKAEISFTTKIVDLIQSKKHCLTRGPLDYDSLQDIKRFIEDKICKQELSMFRDNKINQKTPSIDKKPSIHGRNEQSKVKILIRKKISSKLQSLKASQPYSIVNPLTIQQSKWEEKLVIPQDEAVDLESYVQKQNKYKFSKAYDILDVDTTSCKTTSREEIFTELQSKNMKNQTTIQGFLHKYERKQRRFLRREKSERESKSTVKSSKISSKNEEANLFSTKLQKSQHQYISYLKANNDSKKYQEFQLPLIMTRNSRRITVEK